MEGSSQKEEENNKKVTQIKTFAVPFSLGEIKENITVTTNTAIKHSKEQLIKQAFQFHSQGNIPEAEKYYQYFIDQGFEDHRVFSNYGVILKDLGKSKEAELATRQAIQLKPDFADAHSNLGLILIDLGKLKEAELATRQAIQLKPNLADAHFNLGIILKDLDKLKQAELSTRKAIELNPKFAKAHFNLGNILRRLNKIDESIYSYKQAIELKINYKEAIAEMGKAMTLKGNYKEGLQKVKEVYGSIIFDHNIPTMRIEF